MRVRLVGLAVASLLARGAGGQVSPITDAWHVNDSSTGGLGDRVDSLLNTCDNVPAYKTSAAPHVLPAMSSLKRIAVRTAVCALVVFCILACSDPVSPPGGKNARPIIFTAQTASPASDQLPLPAIYMVRSDGTGLRLLSRGAGSAASPAWSRDGTQIAFSTGADTGIYQQVWVMNADGTNPHDVTPATYECETWRHLSWSPSEDRVAAECGGGTWIFNVRMYDAKSYLTSVAGQTAEVGTPDWSPDGSRFVFLAHDSQSQLRTYSAPAAAGIATLVSDTPMVDVRFSPDGHRLAFTGALPAPRYFGLFVANADGSGIHLVTDTVPGQMFDDGPTWSPDGGWLAFRRVIINCVDVGTPPQHTCHTKWNIYLSRTDGSDVRKLTPDSLLASHPSWF